MAILPFHTSPYLDPIVGSMGLFSVGLGLLALKSPLLFLDAFSLDAKTPEAQKVAKDLFVVYAARDIALGFGITAAAYYGHREIMGWSMLGVGVIALLDGLVTRRNATVNGKGGVGKHGFSCVVGLGLAVACFGYV